MLKNNLLPYELAYQKILNTLSRLFLFLSKLFSSKNEFNCEPE